MTAHFVDENFRILSGDEAAAAVRERSDAKYLDTSGGILRVPLERWKVAQEFERRGWMEKWRGAKDGGNIEHAANFDGYKVLRGMRFEHAVEIGCGPFTNIRQINTMDAIVRLMLVDPLIFDYVKLDDCPYRNFPRALPWFKLVASTIEDFSPQRRSDLVVMINVLEHCYDSHRVLAKILEITEPGATFVFADHIYDEAKVAAVVPDRYYEAGHPLMIPYDNLWCWSRHNFTPIFERMIEAPKDQLEVVPHNGTFYFIGRRK